MWGACSIEYFGGEEQSQASEEGLSLIGSFTNLMARATISPVEPEASLGFVFVGRPRRLVTGPPLGETAWCRSYSQESKGLLRLLIIAL